MKEYMVQNKIPHTSVKPVPFLNIFVPEDVDDYSDASYEKYFDKSIPTMSFGSYALANQLIEAGYTPGGFINDNLNIKIQMEKWGNDVFLNSDAVFSTLSTLQKPEWKNIFIRPVYDTKKMIARVIPNVNFDFAIQLYSAYNKAELEVMIADAKDIIAEYRLFIVHGKVVAHSLYKLRGEVRMQPKVPESIINIAESLCNQWVPAAAFVMDFAETSEGFKVLEVNNINCAGFYACDIPSIVEAFRD
ncbi:hypothetical protein GAP32_376 [Cronobacter phage vB_CsaM_GAP32]|uniref:ATP-grasp domain-containing protein n=1 Tax=Cronobacter phage vB_CsaM_GAP32 TaxID=1141136 RepID=K4F727_9CAUD|nr:hypothetical protein GAP32_376 [Cronobacter phage vB_CsaM_GAP32]AFC21828.1 hypothetical protein GAP32_376 [Cronobacter phage vB_CsaM_GAP32]